MNETRTAWEWLGRPVDRQRLQARLSPSGYVAQRLPHDINHHGHWVLTYLGENDVLCLEVFDDATVADWPELGIVGGQ